MKKLNIMIIALLSWSLAMAQSNAVIDFYDQYQNTKGATRLNMNGQVFQLAVDDDSSADGESLLGKIKQVRLLVLEEDLHPGSGKVRQLIRQVEGERFDNLVKMREHDDHIQVLIRESNDIITDLLLIVNGQDDFVMLSLEGTLNLADLKDLELDLEGADHLQHLPEEKGKIPRA